MRFSDRSDGGARPRPTTWLCRVATLDFCRCASGERFERDRRVGEQRRVDDRAIGDELGLSALTVKSHLARISRKLGTGDRAALVAISIRTGLLA